MKRINNLFEKIISIENLEIADEKARKGKKMQPGIMVHDLTRESNILHLHLSLINKNYKTSPYSVFRIYEPKEREISRLPYFPDRICHHGIMNILEPLFTSYYTSDTYSCIKGRGIHAAARSLKRSLRRPDNNSYCLKLDIKKFYPSIDHSILKNLLRKKFKDQDLLWLLDEIIESAPGLPIGNYLSQYLANFYLTGFDRWIKNEIGSNKYFRYADDMVILSDCKEQLHSLIRSIKQYLSIELHLQVKDNWQVFPVEARGIDFVGYKFYHTHTLLRKGIKKNFARMLVNNRNPASLASYNGWVKHCNSKRLLTKLLAI